MSEQAARAARRLVRGLEDAEAARAAALVGEGLVEEREEPFDRVVRRRLSALDEELCWALPPECRSLLGLAQLAHSLLRHHRAELDQHPVLPESATRRALLLRELVGPGGTVALVGDDDLIGVLLAALGLVPTVLEIDEDVLGVSDLLGQRLGLEVAARQVDLREPMPPDLVGRFDAFCCDPETTRECVGLFAARGAAAVRPGGVGILACAEEFEGLVAEIVVGSGLERRRLLRRFASYRDERFRLSHYRSDLHVLGVPAGARPAVAPAERFVAELFPFGLAGGDHLLVRAEGCAPETLVGEALRDLVSSLSGGESAARVEERHPFPVRVLVGKGPAVAVHATVWAGGTTVELDLAPPPRDEVALRRIAAEVRQALRPGALGLRRLERME